MQENEVDTLREPKRAAEAIAEALIADIRGGRIEADFPLPTERELCETFCASRPTVREALARVQMRGYAIAAAGKRPRAAKPSIVEAIRSAGVRIREVLGDSEGGANLEQMRQFIETGAAREAASRANNVQIARMQRALESNYEAIGTGDFLATDVTFHRALVSVVGNPVLLTLHDLFVSELLSRRPAAKDPKALDSLTYDEHRRVFQAILDGDVVSATNLMDRHLERSYRSRLPVPKSVRDHDDGEQSA